MSQATRDTIHDASRENCKNQFSPEYKSMLKKHQSVKIIKEDGAKTALKNVGPLQTAPKHAGRADHREQSTLTGEKKQQTKHVVERFIDSRIEGRRTLYRVRCYGYGPNVDAWEPAEHLQH